MTENPYEPIDPDDPAEVRPPHRLVEHERWKLGILIGISCIGFLIANVLTPMMFDDAFPALVFTNIVTAQLTLICIWGTLVRGTFWIRLPWTILLLAISWCALAWGIAIDNGPTDIDSMISVGVIWIAGFIASFVPLKIAAMSFGWQIFQLKREITGTDQRYAIRDVMIGTGLLAITMAIARAMLPGEEIDIYRAIKAAQLDQAEPVIAISIFGVVSLLVKLPCIWIALAAPKDSIKGYVLFWAGYCFALTLIEVTVLGAIIGGIDEDLVMGMIVGHQLMGGIMFAVCLPLRGLGYRLEQTRGKSAIPIENHVQ